jgi:hypothetical protein
MTPWRTAAQVADAIKAACESSKIPWEMRHDSNWKARMQQAAGATMSRLRNGASLDEMQTAAERSIIPLMQEFEHGKACTQLVTGVALRLTGETREEREQGKDAVRKALQELPIGASQREMERVCENALAPVRSAIATRQDRAMRDSLLQWVILRHKFMALSNEMQQTAMKEIKEAFNQLPVGTSRSKLDEEVDSVISRHYAIHQQQEHEKKEAERREAEQQQRRRDAESKANAYLNYIREYVESEYEFDGGYFEMYREASRIQEPIREALIAEITADPTMDADTIRARVEELVDDHLE